MKSSLETQYIKRYSLRRLDFLIKPNEMGYWEYMSVRLVILILIFYLLMIPFFSVMPLESKFYLLG